VGPLQFILVVIITWHFIGPATLPGAALIILFTPVQSN